MKYAVYVKYVDENGDVQWGGNFYSGFERTHAERNAVYLVRTNLRAREILKVVSFKCEQDTALTTHDSEEDRKDMNMRRIALLASIPAGVYLVLCVLIILLFYGAV